MRLLLIRHGETVDNVAGLYAGVRDSALTIHGVEQTRRLGQYFARNGVKITHIFSSPLSRAFRTAQAVQEAQKNGVDDIPIVQVVELIEQDFGDREGKPFHTRPNSKQTNKTSQYDQSSTSARSAEAESKETMAKRADVFLDVYLLPLLHNVPGNSESAVAVVSHGLLLSMLWKRLLLRIPRKSLIIAPEVLLTRNHVVLEHLGGWSNTGYLELALSRENRMTDEEDGTSSIDLSKGMKASSTSIAGSHGISSDVPENFAQERHLDRDTSKLHGWSTAIVAIDKKDHLTGLKRQRGGIGSLIHDDSQKKLDGFFKRTKRT